MNTQTHLLVSAALLMRKDQPQRNTAVVVGALLPDLSIYIMYAVAKAQAVPESVIWGQMHFSETWQAWSAVTNSVPIFAALLILGIAKNWVLIWVFAVSALAHIGLDFPVHNDDAHRHFWPFTDWRFESPLSYWNPAHHGNWVMLAELVIGLAAAVFLLRRFRSGLARIAVLLALLPYGLVPLYWMSALG